MKKCEVFACPNRASQMYQMAPGTSAWLCQGCINSMERLVEQETASAAVMAKAASSR